MCIPSHMLEALADHYDKKGKHETAALQRECAKDISREKSWKKIGKCQLQFTYGNGGRVDRIVEIWLLHDKKIETNLWSSYKGQPYERIESMEEKKLYYKKSDSSLVKVSELDDTEKDELIDCIKSKSFELYAESFSIKTNKFEKLTIKKAENSDATSQNVVKVVKYLIAFSTLIAIVHLFAQKVMGCESC